MYLKKIKAVQLISFILIITYIALVCINFAFGVLGENSVFIFSGLIVVIGIDLIFKGTFLKSTSTLWFALILILSAIAIIMCRLMKLNLTDFTWVFMVIPIIPSIINLIVFHAKIYIKVIIINISLAAPFVLMQFTKITWYWLLLIAVFVLGLAILICRNIDFDKEKV